MAETKCVTGELYPHVSGVKTLLIGPLCRGSSCEFLSKLKKKPAQNGSFDAPGSIAQNTRFRHCQPFRRAAGEKMCGKNVIRNVPITNNKGTVWDFLFFLEKCAYCKVVISSHLLIEILLPQNETWNQRMVNLCFGFLRSPCEGIVPQPNSSIEQ